MIPFQFDLRDSSLSPRLAKKRYQKSWNKPQRSKLNSQIELSKRASLGGLWWFISVVWKRAKQDLCTDGQLGPYLEIPLRWKGKENLDSKTCQIRVIAFSSPAHSFSVKFFRVWRFKMPSFYQFKDSRPINCPQDVVAIIMISDKIL